jgi:hypothetical protein
VRLLRFSNRLGAEGREGSEEWYHFRYTVVGRGVDYVIIRILGGIQDGDEFRFQFVDGGRGLRRLMRCGPDLELDEKLEKVVEPDVRP